MDVEEVRRYVGKKVLIVLNNGFKYTTILPSTINTTFTIKDKYDNYVTIDCDMIKLISEVD